MVMEREPRRAASSVQFLSWERSQALDLCGYEEWERTYHRNDLLAHNVLDDARGFN